MADRDPTNSTMTAYGILLEGVPDLEEGIRTALNGPYYAIQVAIGQDDGGVAGLHASGLDDDIARRLSDRIVAAGWTGSGVPAWDSDATGQLLPDGETVAPGDLPDAFVGKAVSDFLTSVATQCRVDPEATFADDDREYLIGKFKDYLEMEAAYAPAPAP